MKVYIDKGKFQILWLVCQWNIDLGHKEYKLINIININWLLYLWQNNKITVWTCYDLLLGDSIFLL